MKKTIAIILLALPPYMCFAQQKQTVQEVDPIQRTQQAIEKAMSQARAQQLSAEKNGPKPGFNFRELSNTQGVDPQTLAAKYQSSGIGKPRSPEELMVFVSTSMPKKALVMLAEQASATGATMVIRGLVAPLGTKGAMQQTMEAMQPVAETGAKIQIDPEAFSRYDIKAVPAFVISMKEETCSTEQCDAKAVALVGDVTLEYALEHWISRGGSVGKIAERYLKMIERVRP